MSHIFISYSHKDKDYVHQLQDALQQEGFEVWIDDRIDYGDEWPMVIQDSLDSSDAVILVATEESYKSKWVQKEVTRAQRINKPFFPLLLSGNPWLSIESTQYVDVRDKSLPPERFYKRLANATQRNKSVTSILRQEESAQVKPSIRTFKDLNDKTFGLSSIKLFESSKRENNKTSRSISSPRLNKPLLVAIIGAVATIVAATISIAPQIFKVAPAPTNTPLSTLVQTSIPSTLQVISTLTATPFYPPTQVVTACSPPNGWTLYTIGSGETLSSIAEKFGISVNELQKENCLLSTNISTGYGLYVPLPTITPTLGVGSSTISPKDGMTLMYVPAGNFLMGSSDSDPNAQPDEKPQHIVYIDAFWIDKTDVTNKLYALCVSAKACAPPYYIDSATHSSYYGNSEFDNYPMINVSWGNATAYCKWAGRQLPTEAQWEKAARGIDGRIYPWGNNAPNDNLLNYSVSDTTAVGSYPNGASQYGALDMAGNVWQWVNDWYSATYYQNSPSSNPLGPDSGQYKVFRGSTWSEINGIHDVRSASRTWSNPVGTENIFIGFRCAQNATP